MATKVVATATVRALNRKLASSRAALVLVRFVGGATSDLERATFLRCYQTIAL